MRAIFGTSFAEEEKRTIVNELINKFAENEAIREGNLIWNSLRVQSSSFPIENLKEFERLVKTGLYFYDERKKELYSTNFEEVLKFVENLEPWDNVDAYLFDSSFSWLIVITHEDILLTVGI
ncbi:hypothetical protein B5M42_015250 [Paenibacillus athensensis]|uniref:Uncharacterized protein n=1 Tax=Paenibacillus athensensis TaxID=1967502 RepID=A0A4Y8PRM4_9BACL|nr:DUF6756 family protein [Paenibacillus athensensis]MCD1260169.1 hypothetical protein [Paenibacillus athensensis]